MMKEIINNFEDLKSLMMPNKRSESPCQDKCGNNPNGSISNKLKHAATLHFPNQNVPVNSIPKNILEGDIIANNSLVYQISISYIMKFLRLLYKKFQTELEFHERNRKEISELRQDSFVSSAEIETIKIMLYFDCFIIVNKQRNPNFLKIESIIQRIKLVRDLLQEAEQQLKTENYSKNLFFFNESECQKSFSKLFSDSLFQNEYFSKICSEFWRFMRSAQLEEPTNENTQVSFESLKLFVYGISFPTYHLDDFPLHQAVFTSNLPMIRRICARENSPVFYCHVEQCDPTGVTPLMLAVLLGNKDAALILTNHGADPKHRSYPFARTPLEEAVKRKKRGVIKTLLRANNIIKQAHWENNKNALIELLSKLPDFSFEMSWECDSKIIPFVKKVTPSDTYKIYKLGSSLRIDLSLLGWSKLQSIRGNSSIIFNGIGEEKGRLIVIDHEKGLCADLFDDVCGLVLENKIDDLMKQEQMQSEIKTENVVFKPALNWKGDIVNQNIEGYPTIKYNAKGTFSVLLTKRNILVDFEFKTFNSFDEYFSSIMQEPLWIFQENKGSKTLVFSPIACMIRYKKCYQSVVSGLSEKDDVNTTANSESEKSTKSKKDTQKEKANISQKKLLKNYTKNIGATVYMCDNFPLSLEHLMPVLDILSNVSPQINKLKNFLETQSNINKNSFPLKAYIPIMLSVNAIVLMKNFKFKTPDRILFEYNKMIKPKSVPNKKIDIKIKEDKLKTEGISEDEQMAQKCWENLLQKPDDDLTPYHISESKLSLNETKYENGELEDSMEKSNQTIHSFSRRIKSSVLNRDLIDILNGRPNLDEDLEECEISEKYSDEILKLNSHPTSLAKTITSIEEKFRSKENGFVTRSITTFQTQNNYKSIEDLHHERANISQYTEEDLKEQKSSGRDRVCKNNFKDLHMKKMLRYNIRNEEQKASPEKTICEFFDESRMNQKEKMNMEGWRKIQEVVSQNLRYQRVKSADMHSSKRPNTFLNNKWMNF